MRTGPATALFAIYADERQVSFVRCRTWCLEAPSHLYNDEYQIPWCAAIHARRISSNLSGRTVMARP
jgi:hypothetical protein